MRSDLERCDRFFSYLNHTKCSDSNANSPEQKLRVAVLFGGKSAEHEVSLRSAENIMAGLDSSKYDVVPIKIEKDGQINPRRLRDIFDHKVDVVFPVLHGSFGEDGTVQGLLRLADVPFVGAGVLGSAIAMDKEVSKNLFKKVGLNVPDFLVSYNNDQNIISFSDISSYLGLPFFVKPANLGSSVGVHKIHLEKEFQPAVEDAFKYDHKILFEKYIAGREIECSVLGNDQPSASVPGEILITKHEFYSYQAKYDIGGMILEAPAKLNASVIKKVQEASIRAFKALKCEGMARVDFFLQADGTLVINEINTIPGFTNTSVYPKLWELSGMSYSQLLDQLIKLALERFSREKKLKTSSHP